MVQGQGKLHSLQHGSRCRKTRHHGSCTYGRRVHRVRQAALVAAWQQVQEDKGSWQQHIWAQSTWGKASCTRCSMAAGAGGQGFLAAAHMGAEYMAQ
eukprot:1157497-Pelagomonas_calceolata.AAC.5